MKKPSLKNFASAMKKLTVKEFKAIKLAIKNKIV